MRLVERVHLVASGRLGFGLTDDHDCHVYAVDGGEEIALIDAGGGRAVEALIENLRGDGLDPRRVRHIFITHAHGDHAAGAGPLRAALAELIGIAPRVYASAECAPWLRSGDEAATSVHVARLAGIYPLDFEFAPCPVDRALVDGERVGVGDLTLRAIATPGHAAGHLSFLMATSLRICLFGGDALFYGGRVSLQNTWDCSPTDTAATVEHLAELEWDALFPGHLTMSLRDGRRHARSAAAIAARLGMPPPLVV
ncbi:MAG: MBL fold metallo-hydrolase [Chloroflexota bacterium]|nr:MAG: MBL fold metallo-hydrolase [Chloroflexota bacterium]